VVAFSLLAVVLMLTLTTRTAAVARLGYEIGNLERQIESLERAGEQLRLQGAQLGAVARIEEQASTRLSMTRPQEVRLVMAPSPAVNAAVAEGGSVTFLATSAEPGAVYAAAGVLTQGAGRQSPATQYMAAAGVDEPAGGEPGGAGGGGWLLRLAAALLRWLPSTAPVEATPLP
jgi:cell division protein FtsL